jgi:hypothetical protein
MEIAAAFRQRRIPARGGPPGRALRIEGHARVSRLLIIALFFEVGVVLMVVPWSNYWEHNYFVQAAPFVEAIATNAFVRGAITGLGLVNVLAGFAEIGGLFLSHRSDDPSSAVTPTSPADERR